MADKQIEDFENIPENKEADYTVLLRRRDERTFEERVKRLEFTESIIPPERTFFCVDVEMVLTFREAETTFINGQFIATIILAQTFVEKAVYGKLKYVFRINTRGGFAKMLELMKEKNLLSESIIDQMQSIRKTRNPFVHYIENNYSILNRVSKTTPTLKKDIYSVLEKDAKNAIQVMVWIATEWANFK